MDNSVTEVWLMFKHEDNNILLFYKTMTMSQAVKCAIEMKKEGYKLADAFAKDDMQKMGILK